MKEQKKQVAGLTFGLAPLEPTLASLVSDVLAKPTQKPSISDLTAEIKKATKPVQKMRTVRLVYNSCCGCGCTKYEIWRNVPEDSKLKDGDVVKRTLKDDEWGDELD